MSFIDLSLACILREKNSNFPQKTQDNFFFSDLLILTRLGKKSSVCNSCALIFSKEDFFVENMTEIFEMTKSTHRYISTLLVKYVLLKSFSHLLVIIRSTVLEMGTFCLQTDSIGIFLLILRFYSCVLKWQIHSERRYFSIDLNNTNQMLPFFVFFFF